MIPDAELTELARAAGFSDAAVLGTDQLSVFPEYRKYCEENTCGMYNRHPACPPAAGTVEELESKFRRFRKALVLQTKVQDFRTGDFAADWERAKVGKAEHNTLTDGLLTELQQLGIGETLRMSAGPWKTNSCMSAYCINAQMMADACGMQCWANDGWIRYFSLILFDAGPGAQA